VKTSAMRPLLSNVRKNVDQNSEDTATAGKSGFTYQQINITPVSTQQIQTESQGCSNREPE